MAEREGGVMNIFWFGMILYIVIGIFVVGVLNGFSNENFDVVSFLFMGFYPLAFVIMLVMGIVCGLYEVGRKVGRKIDEFVNKMNW